MRVPLLLLALSLTLVACPSPGPREAPAEAGEAELYTCGMHPEVVQEGPGSCPICGMDLTPMRRSGVADPTVTVDPRVVQNMGVRIAPVRVGPIFRHVRSVGEIEVAEDEISVVNLRYSGWVEKIHVDETGSEVKQGQALFDIYSPELVSAQEELLLALRTEGQDGPRARAARARLLNWDVPASVVDRVASRLETSRRITVRAPRAGFVLHKQVVEGARVEAGKDLYRIGNLQEIWVLTEVYESDAPWIRVGQKAVMELEFQAGAPLVGAVSYVYPTLNRTSRTLRVRLEFPNPGLALKPGMFATVRIETRRKDDALIIPTEAILHSGERQLVFVAEGIGRYVPRDIDTGLVGDRRLTEVVRGLEPGERVVVSGQFLLDSESQLQEAVHKLLRARLQVPGPEPEAAETGEQVFSCPMHPEIRQAEFGTCPICGMDLVSSAEPAPPPAAPPRAGAPPSGHEGH